MAAASLEHDGLRLQTVNLLLALDLFHLNLFFFGDQLIEVPYVAREFVFNVRVLLQFLQLLQSRDVVVFGVLQLLLAVDD